ncbi:hypothetical protein [Bordetella bronchiseptica]|uniref:hypothetical protein n=1 Tax=Bordetella bronchiseptica TaxID=518 RepID=UPI00052835E2|nr:hypothetical protein [Bordetella bronchiseptica]
MNIIHAARRLALVALASLALSGCETLTNMATSVRDAFAPAPQSDAAVEAPPAPGTPVADSSAGPADESAEDPLAPGFLHFVLPDSPWGTEGWRFEALAAKSTAGFIPLQSDARLGYHLKLTLWPDQYQVRVSLRGETRLSQWVTVEAGRHTVIHVDLGVVMDDVLVLHGEDALKRLAESLALSRDLGLAQTFSPFRLIFDGGLEGRWHGPRGDGQARGTGRLELFRAQSRVARLENALALPGARSGFEGVPVFDDGRQVAGRWQGRSLAEGSVMRFPDGRVFQGGYTGTEPDTGKLTLTDGRTWTGKVSNGQPTGNGDLTLPDGTVVHDVPGIDESAFDGEYECTAPSGRTVNCAYFEGERQASLAQYKRRDKARQAATAREVAQARELAEVARQSQPASRTDPMSKQGLAAAVAAAQENQARHQDAPAVDGKLDRPQLSNAAPAASGCARVEGRFSTTTGLSKVSFDAGGRGHFWQKTYGGARAYTFDVDFRWTSTDSKMTFDYDEAVYRDATGNEMQRTRMPGGTVACSYDGRELSIGGVSYFRL